jgi:hypothetical protein
VKDSFGKSKSVTRSSGIEQININLAACSAPHVFF